MIIGYLFIKIKPRHILVIFISTYTDGQAPEQAAWFVKYVTEMSCDFRYEKGALKGLQFAICGLGNSLYEENFNKCAVQLDKAFAEMHATRVAPLYCCDENTVKSKHGSLEADVTYWQNSFFEKLKFHLKPSQSGGCCKQGDENNNNSTCCQKSNDNQEEEEEEEEVYEDTTSGEEDEENYMSDMGDDLDEDGSVKKQANGLVDMEDLGKVVNGMKKKKAAAAKNGAEPKEMITPMLRKSLEKQGYKLIGTHSGVKLCRWTKSMLRGEF